MNVELLCCSALGIMFLSSINGELSPAGQINGVKRVLENPETKRGFPYLAAEAKKLSNLYGESCSSVQEVLSMEEGKKVSLGEEEKNDFKFLAGKTKELQQKWEVVSKVLGDGELSEESIKRLILDIINLEAEVIKCSGRLNVNYFLTIEFLRRLDECLENGTRGLKELLSDPNLICSIAPRSVEEE
ncbi:hypothetical protein M970_051560 [Encephalitozoon cuniculi EcunIII-L]|nr:hypothetical protein M970_051560 [Encephalitozoon cuniculi EcunIII-L]UYI27953.1 hypothetical protein J0A71_08g18430 [Encephalitozoon cuniculi]